MNRVPQRRSQRGITFIGWLILLVPLAIVVYAGIRLTPIYLNYMRVSHSLTELAQEAQINSDTTAADLRSSLSKHFDIEGINFPTVSDIDIVRGEGGGWTATADYQDTAPLFGNLAILVNFHKQVSMQ